MLNISARTLLLICTHFFQRRLTSFNMTYMGAIVLLLISSTCQIVRSQCQDCVSRRELQSTLRNIHNLISAQEISFLQSVRNLRKKLNLLQNITDKLSSNVNVENNCSTTCPPLKPPANGRMLGRVFRTGHEVHFLCNPGFKLSGSETRECLYSQRWRGVMPTCSTVDNEVNNSATSSLSTYNSSTSASSISTFARPSRCLQFQGSMHCTCEQGYSFNSQEKGLCIDVDECEIFHLTHPGRVCFHVCVNTAGSYHCECPTGYSVNRDNRSCQDIDECERGTHNCTSKQVCVNTFGGHRCMVAECPRFRNATYIKTSPLRCERNPCVQGNKACFNAPVSINFHFMSVPSNMSTPRVLFRLFTAHVLGDALRFSLLGNRGTVPFTLQRSGRQSGELLLVEPVQGPATLEAEVEMREMKRWKLLGRYLTKVTLFVSPYTF